MSESLASVSNMGNSISLTSRVWKPKVEEEEKCEEERKKKKKEEEEQQGTHTAYFLFSLVHFFFSLFFPFSRGKGEVEGKVKATLALEDRRDNGKVMQAQEVSGVRERFRLPVRVRVFGWGNY